MTALFVMHQMHFSHPTPTECDPIGAAVTYTTPQNYHDGIHGRINTSSSVYRARRASNVRLGTVGRRRRRDHGHRIYELPGHS